MLRKISILFRLQVIDRLSWIYKFDYRIDILTILLNSSTDTPKIWASCAGGNNVCRHLFIYGTKSVIYTVQKLSK